MKFLKNLKKTRIYYLFLKFIIIPLYDFIWHYIINFKSKIIGNLFLIKKLKQKYISLGSNSKILVKNNPEIFDLSNKIKQSISQDFINEKVAYINSNEYKEYLKENSDNEAQIKNPFNINLWDYLNNQTKSQILDFATSDLVIKTATKYLGVFPRLTMVNLKLNIPNGLDPIASQLWHRDDFGYKSLDFFIAITPVNDENGPLVTLAKKDPLNIFYRVKNEINSKLKGERGKIQDEKFDYLIEKNSNENFVTLKGDVGTCLLIDSFRNYHKGGYCKTNHRIMLRINFMTDDCTADFAKNSFVEKYNYNELLNKKDFFTKYLIRDKNIIFRNNFVPRRIFSMYHALSIKK